MTKAPTREPRYLTISKALSIEQAEACRSEEVAHLRSKIEEIQYEIGKLINTPLPTTTEECIEVFPDDPRYAIAEDKFDPKKYKGTWRFVNLPPTKS